MGNRHPIHPGKHLNEIVHGRRSITADTALRIGQALGMTPEFWPNLQRVYDLDLVRPPPPANVAMPLSH